FDTAGEYKYTISEEKGDDEHINYDETVYEVTVTVTNEDGVLKADVQVKDDADITFENIWTPDEIQVSLPVGEKELTGGKNLEDGIFTFALRNAGGIVLETVFNKDGKITFSDLTFDTAGEYKYTISEEKGDDEHINYDETVYEVTVTVTNEDGVLKADVQVKDDAEITFENVWTPDQIHVNLPVGTKVLDGTKKLEDDMFRFVLKDASGKEIETVTNKAGRVTFDELSFETIGEYKYTVSEVKGDDKSVTYDETVYEVTVTITNENGVLKADVQIKDAEEILFINIWTPEKIFVSLPVGEKKLVGRDLADGEFEFVLMQDGKEIDRVTNKDGKIVFDDLGFTEVGEYVYTISEVTGDAENVTYSDAVYEVTITITDENGLLVSKVAADEILFINQYEEPVENPDTGVGTAVGLWAALFLVSGGGLIVGARKKKEEDVE
ncbi:MAG: hypothetical protein IJC85_00255, partial [Oscillospiraceae bacterium]|nr:hypothetical protein [Oscillospiraceae bacterium]